MRFSLYETYICSGKNSLPKLWGDVRFSWLQPTNLLCKELVTSVVRRCEIQFGYLLSCSVKNSLPKLWGGVRFSSVKTLYLLCEELVTCFILGARRTDICINWKLSRGEFSKKRPKLGLWCKNDKSFEKELSPPAFQVLTCGETTQRELIKKTFKNWSFSFKLPKMSLCLTEFTITNSVTADGLFTKN